jgi:HEAT repeat protein
MRRVPRELLARAKSDDWGIRRGAARELAGFEDADAVAALHRLLADPHDTGPIEAAAQALLTRCDAFGVDVILTAVARTGDDDHLLYFVARDAARLGCHSFWRLAAERAATAHGDVRDGAREMLEYTGRASA